MCDLRLGGGRLEKLTIAFLMKSLLVRFRYVEVDCSLVARSPPLPYLSLWHPFLNRFAAHLWSLPKTSYIKFWFPLSLNSSAF